MEGQLTQAKDWAGWDMTDKLQKMGSSCSIYMNLITVYSSDRHFQPNYIYILVELAMATSSIKRGSHFQIWGLPGW
jgi:hydroxyacyl-ACP dehydratase HTD2-like protein with hotdog domain